MRRRLSGPTSTPPSVLQKLPFTIPELVQSSPCRSSDGVLYTGTQRPAAPPGQGGGEAERGPPGNTSVEGRREEALGVDSRTAET